MAEFKNIKFFEGLIEVSFDEALKDKYFNLAYNSAKISFHFVIDDINRHDGVLVLNNSDRDNMIGLDNMSLELQEKLKEKGIKLYRRHNTEIWSLAI